MYDVTELVDVPTGLFEHVPISAIKATPENIVRMRALHALLWAVDPYNSDLVFCYCV